MKNTFKIIFLIACSFFAFQAFAGELPCLKAESSGDKHYIEYCDNLASCTSTYEPSKDGSNILKIKQIPFMPAQLNIKNTTETDPISNYKAYLSELGSTVNYFGVKPLEQSRIAYIETQNAIYNCAVIATKLKVTTKILKYIKSNDTSNIKTKLEAQVQSLKTESSKRKCNDASAEKDTSYKEILLKGVTYHYCNYRFYLNYLSNFPQENLNAPSVSAKVTTSAQDKINSADLAKRASKQTDLMYKEIRHAKQVYNQAFPAFAEFENTYGLHVMLLFIYDDYIQLRKNLSSLMSPISQLAYKIPQAQKK